MYIFYDTETTGLEKDFSQILQIGLIMTDDDMNILAMKKIESRLSPWTVPAPGALLTTGFDADFLKNTKNTSFEMMQEVDQWVRSQYWPVTFSGYNTIGYDDDVLGQNLHENLLDRKMLSAKNPSNGQYNTRFDVMIAVQATAAYMPGVLKLDIMNDSGKAPSMKLGNVARQNGITLSTDDAHDGMNDTKATVGVAKLVKTAAPQIWDQLHKTANMFGVNDFIKNNDVFTYTSYSFGQSKSSVVTAMGPRGGKGAWEVMFDLSIDPAPYMKMTVEELKQVFIDQAKKPAKDAPPPLEPFRLALKTTQPIMMPMELSDAVLPKGFDDKVAAQRAAAIKADPKFMENVREAAELAKKAKPWKKPTWTKQPEELIWKDPKPEIKDKLDVWLKEFRDAPSWKEAAALADGFRARFKDEMKEDPNITRFAKFATRIVFQHAPEELTEAKQEAMKRSIASHILSENPDVPWMTVAKARKELAKIEEERTDEKKKKKWAEVTDTDIRSLKLYYTALEKEYAPYLPAKKATPPSLDSSTPPAAGALPPVNDNPVAANPPVAPVDPKKANDTFKPT